MRPIAIEWPMAWHWVGVAGRRLRLTELIRSNPARIAKHIVTEQQKKKKAYTASMYSQA